MKLHIISKPHCKALKLTGRLDAHHSAPVQHETEALLASGTTHLLFDLGGVDYISSAGLRVFMRAQKMLAPRQGKVGLVNPQPYCRNVLEIAGFANAFPVFATLAEAEAAWFPHLGAPLHGDWSRAESWTGETGELRILPGTNEPGFIEIVGDIQDVLAARITPGHVRSKPFSSTEYSIGLGALGDKMEDYLRLMGEMITIGGTMVWLPCDGHDTPDFLIPKNDTGKVTLHTGFNASLSGPFNDYFEFRSRNPEGTGMSELYRFLFDIAKQRRPDYRGALGLAMRAEMTAVYGSGVLKAPIASQAPRNGKPITDPSNFGEWFEFDTEPKHKKVTGLIAGCGVDLTCDPAVFDARHFPATFYINPANTGAATELLHNHGVFFSPLPFPAEHFTLEGEIERVVEAGDFIDMRHLLDKTAVSRAVIGAIYVQDFRGDPSSEKIQEVFRA